LVEQVGLIIRQMDPVEQAAEVPVGRMEEAHSGQKVSKSRQEGKCRRARTREPDEG